jgi:hypothetical protein
MAKHMQSYVSAYAILEWMPVYQKWSIQGDFQIMLACSAFGRLVAKSIELQNIHLFYFYSTVFAMFSRACPPAAAGPDHRLLA